MAAARPWRRATASGAAPKHWVQGAHAVVMFFFFFFAVVSFLGVCRFFVCFSLFFRGGLVHKSG